MSQSPVSINSVSTEGDDKHQLAATEIDESKEINDTNRGSVSLKARKSLIEGKLRLISPSSSNATIYSNSNSNTNTNTNGTGPIENSSLQMTENGSGDCRLDTLKIKNSGNGDTGKVSILLQGWLYKCTLKSSKSRLKWRKRYFALFSNGVLAYSKTPSLKHVKRRFVLSDYTALVPYLDQQNTFRKTPKERIWQLQGSNLFTLTVLLKPVQRVAFLPVTVRPAIFNQKPSSDGKTLNGLETMTCWKSHIDLFTADSSGSSNESSDGVRAPLTNVRITANRAPLAKGKRLPKQPISAIPAALVQEAPPRRPSRKPNNSSKLLSGSSLSSGSSCDSSTVDVNIMTGDANDDDHVDVDASVDASVEMFVQDLLDMIIKESLEESKLSQSPLPFPMIYIEPPSFPPTTT